MQAERPVSLPSSSVVACVDDDSRVRESVENLLDSAGIACVTFASGEAFLESGMQASAACLLVDVRMGGMTGLELQRVVRAFHPHLPVIFISAHQDDAARSVALAEGAIAFLDKPFEVDVLLNAIRWALEGRGP
jgi:FixJ family two-component response regulator